MVHKVKQSVKQVYFVVIRSIIVIALLAITITSLLPHTKT